MKRVRTAALILLATIFPGGTLWATIPEKYQTILDRNAFGLNPPPLVETTAPVVTPPANIKLTGFANTYGQRKAYFMIHPKDPKEQTQYINLSEGQREGILELIKISEEAGEVKIRNTGVDMVLSFEKNGAKPANLASAPPGPAPMQPQQSAVYNANASSPVVVNTYNPKGTVTESGMPQPGTQGNPISAAAMGSPSPADARTIPTRTLRLPPAQNPQGGIVPSGVANSSVVFNGGNAQNTVFQDSNQKQTVDPAVQLINMHAQSQRARQEGRPYPPPPPVPGQ